MSSIVQNIRIALTMLQRDMRVYAFLIPDAIIDGGIISLLYYSIFYVLGSAMGFSKIVAQESFLGTMVMLIVSPLYSRMIEDLIDLNYDNFLSYRRTQSLPLSWFLATWIASYVLYAIAATLPLIFMGGMVLGFLPTTLEHWIYFGLHYAMSILFISLFLSIVAIYTSFMWVRFNMFHRILIPLYQFGCVYFAWKKAYAFSPKISWLLLLDPFTYCAEGYRASLLSSDAYLPLWLCTSVLMLLNIMCLGVFYGGIKKKLDWL